MNISFTGINNLYIGKKSSSSYGEYITDDGHFANGNKKHLDVLIKCVLTNDEKGKHIADFDTALKKSGIISNFDPENPDEPIEIELLAEHTELEKNASPFTNFKLCGAETPIMRETLPFYTYMAKLTLDISNLGSASNAQKEYAQTVNKFVQNEAVYYIDNVM